MDGSGYSFHHAGVALDIGSRIVSVAHIITALAEDSPHRKGLDRRSALETVGDLAVRGSLGSDVAEVLLASHDRMVGEAMIA
jgi:HD-GYP domain-containing protein (c-di-GMP phosphodiesterase class II)